MTNQTNSEKTRNYEILYFLPVTLSSDEIKSINHKVNEIITKHQGRILKEEDIGKHKLAYMIKNARHGHYILIVFSAQLDQVSKINHHLQLMPEILRHQLSIKQDIKKVQVDLKKITRPEDKPVKPLQAKPEEKDTPAEKVDIHELDRKIDELLTEHDV